MVQNLLIALRSNSNSPSPPSLGRPSRACCPCALGENQTQQAPNWQARAQGTAIQHSNKPQTQQDFIFSLFLTDWKRNLSGGGWGGPAGTTMVVTWGTRRRGVEALRWKKKEERIEECRPEGEGIKRQKKRKRKPN